MIELRVRRRNYVGYSPKYSEATFELMQFRGKRCSLNGEEIELFTLKTFALALDRAPGQVRDWERKKLIPRPLFKMSSGNVKTRYYSHSQTLNCHRIVMARWKGRKYLQDRAMFLQFIADIREVFYTNVVCVDQHGHFITEAMVHGG